MATYSSVSACKIPCTEEPGGLHTVHGATESDMTEYTQRHTRTHRNKMLKYLPCG